MRQKAPTIAIPSTIERARARLADIDSLLTSKGWERAAVVAAFVRLGEAQGAHAKKGMMGTVQFAALGIAGLTKVDTVRMYVQAWLDANGGEYPQPGKTVALPTDPWPPTRTGTDGYESDEGAVNTVRKLVAKHGDDAPAIIAKALDPKTQTKVMHAISDERAKDLPQSTTGGKLVDTGIPNADLIDARHELDSMLVSADNYALRICRTA